MSGTETRLMRTTKQKLLKLAKGLQKFSFDEITMISEFEEEELSITLNELVESRLLAKNGETYFYVNPQKESSKKKQDIIQELDYPKANISVLKIEEMKGYDVYSKLTGYRKEFADKHLYILSTSWNLKGERLDLFAKQWNKVHPDMKTSYASIMNKRKRMRTMGLLALIPRYGHCKGSSIIDNELYEYFKEYYLSFGTNTFIKSVELAINKFKNSRSEAEMQEFLPPSKTSFKRRLLKEFTQEEISAFRQKIIMPKVNMPEPIKIEEDEIIENKEITFKDASAIFLERVKNDLKKSSYVSTKGYLKNHLMPMFGEHKLVDITQKMVINFRDAKIEEGFSISSANSYMECLEQIIREYLPVSNQLDKVRTLRKKKENFYSDIRILEIDEIKKLLKTAEKHYPDFYPFLLTAITTGLTRGEILGLTWDCVDMENKKLNISKSLYRGELARHRTKHSIRQVDLIDDTAKVLAEGKLNAVKSDFVFPNSEGNFQDPDNMIKRRFNPVVEKSEIIKIRFLDLRDTYASLLIKQNVPLTYIQQQLGHSSVDVTAKRYEFLLAKQQIKKLQILEEVI